jgi:ABC-type methionine transport system permease subunit
VGGWIENVLMRTIDTFLSIPEIFVAIVVMAFLSSGLPTLVFTIGLLYFPQFARVVYAVTNSMKRKEFVEASVALGANAPRILFRQILPNIASIIVVQITFTISFAMLLEAGLSFLGLGVMPPRPSWGQMIGDLKDYIQINPLPVIFPSVALFLAVFSINTLGDWLQDWLNPEVGQYLWPAPARRGWLDQVCWGRIPTFVSFRGTRPQSPIVATACSRQRAEGRELGSRTGRVARAHSGVVKGFPVFHGRVTTPSNQMGAFSGSCLRFEGNGFCSSSWASVETSYLCIRTLSKARLIGRRRLGKAGGSGIGRQGSGVSLRERSG